MLRKDIERLLGLYFITDHRVGVLTPVDQVKIVVTAGVTAVQYRNKNFQLCDSYSEVEEIASFCRKREAIFIINDNVLLARAVKADGVHLGQNDDKVSLARNILGDDAIIGLSISSFDEFKKSDLSECDYLGVGPVFTTTTKQDAKLPHGVEVLRKIVHESPIPVVAIGGINLVNAESCFNCGVSGIAVISGITSSDNPSEVAHKLAHLKSSLLNC